jgi:hypothetical protein
MKEIMKLMAEGWALTRTKKKWSLTKVSHSERLSLQESQNVNARTAQGMIDRELIYRTCGPYKTIKSYSLTRYGREIMTEGAHGCPR